MYAAATGLWRWRGNPLRRTTDLLEAWTALAALVLICVGAPVAGWLVGVSADAALQESARLQQERRLQVVAEVLGPAAAPEPGSVLLSGVRSGAAAARAGRRALGGTRRHGAHRRRHRAAGCRRAGRHAAGVGGRRRRVDASAADRGHRPRACRPGGCGGGPRARCSSSREAGAWSSGGCGSYRYACLDRDWAGRGPDWGPHRGRRLRAARAAPGRATGLRPRVPTVPAREEARRTGAGGGPRGRAPTVPGAGGGPPCRRGDGLPYRRAAEPVVPARASLLAACGAPCGAVGAARAGAVAVRGRGTDPSRCGERSGRAGSRAPARGPLAAWKRATGRRRARATVVRRVGDRRRAEGSHAGRAGERTRRGSRAARDGTGHGQVTHTGTSRWRRRAGEYPSLTAALEAAGDGTSSPSPPAPTGRTWCCSVR